MKHPRCYVCSAHVRAWFHRHAPEGAKAGWRCIIHDELFFCNQCAPQDGTGAHDESKCR